MRNFFIIAFAVVSVGFSLAFLLHPAAGLTYLELSVLYGIWADIAHLKGRK
jgi:multidrug transporter EmrE-like cation transporter